MHQILKGALPRLAAATTTSSERVESYAMAFWRRGVPLNLPIWSIIDVKKVHVARPTNNQRALYSGHTKYHCFKFQTLQGPDGLILHCTYSNDGRRGDGHVLRESNLLAWASGNPALAGYFIFGDSAYPNQVAILSMFRGRNLPAPAVAFNLLMAKVRVSVEWGYMHVVKYFPMLDWEKQLKVEHVPVEALWHLAVFLTNCHTCHFGGNQISQFFSCSPPSLEHYLNAWPAWD